MHCRGVAGERKAERGETTNGHEDLEVSLRTKSSPSLRPSPPGGGRILASRFANTVRVSVRTLLRNLLLQKTVDGVRGQGMRARVGVGVVRVHSDGRGREVAENRQEV